MTAQTQMNTVDTHYANAQRQSAEVQYLLAEERHRNAEAQFDTAYQGEVGLMGLDILCVAISAIVACMRKGIERDNPQLKQLLEEFEELKKNRAKLTQNTKMSAEEISTKVKEIDSRLKEIKEGLPWKRILLMQFKDKWIDIYLMPILSAIAYLLAAYSLWLWRIKKKLKDDLDVKRQAFIKEEMDKKRRLGQQTNV
ncbi:MAG: hypothetical protein J6S85_12260 [Methanobrevibacter sp.]|nr:hypothetical protein [Methanobrevibacter sp.]